jgi:hypothetical protein
MRLVKRSDWGAKRARVAHNRVVCRHGYVFGRGFGIRSAVNGTKAANDRYFAVCFLANDTPGRAVVTPAAYAALASSSAPTTGASRERCWSGRILHSSPHRARASPLQGD